MMGILRKSCPVARGLDEECSSHAAEDANGDETTELKVFPVHRVVDLKHDDLVVP